MRPNVHTKLFSVYILITHLKKCILNLKIGIYPIALYTIVNGVFMRGGLGPYQILVYIGYKLFLVDT